MHEFCVLRKIRINNLNIPMGKASGSWVQYVYPGSKGLLELYLWRNIEVGGNNSGLALMG